MQATKDYKPSSLPFLPGNVYSDPTVTKYHKSQLLQHKDGSVQENTILKQEVNSELLESMKRGEPLKLSNIPDRPKLTNEAVPADPIWLRHDKQVLRFFAFFQEHVVEDPNENFRIRKVIVLYYLDDDTIHIMEPKIENSGIPQGVFLKRSKVPLPDGTRDYQWVDLKVGMDFEVYGRVFRIVDCDDFTRQFYLNDGITLDAAERYPDDPFVHTRAMVDMKQNPPDLAETKEYFEKMLGGSRPNGGLKQYLDNDRKVLSFKILWNDTAYHGGQKFYTLNFYLADSQMEVKEQWTENSGRNNFPLLLKKSKVPKQPVMTHFPGMSLKKEEYYDQSDLICGREITIFGRACKIFDCDAFTREWYRERMGIE